MSAATFLDALGDARSRWLDGDTDAWSHYAERCLQLEAELRSEKRGCSSKCSKCRAAAQETDPCRRGDTTST